MSVYYQPVQHLLVHGTAITKIHTQLDVNLNLIKPSKMLDLFQNLISWYHQKN